MSRRTHWPLFFFSALLFSFVWQFAATNIDSANAAPAKKKIVFVAGKKSHGYGAHEHYAGCVLLAKALQNSGLNIETDVYRDGWPKDPHAFDGADAIVMYCDGGVRHPMIGHLDVVDALVRRGVGVVCIHYGVEVSKGEPGDHLLDWIGGYFEADWSVNPHWRAKFTTFPKHPITRGVQPFEIDDEWYYHMRFRPKMQGVTPILSAIPPASTLSRPDGPHSGNPAVRKTIGQPQHLAWASENKHGSRGFGFTGGHFHWNWGDENFRKVMLNALVWVAHGEVPQDGVNDKPVRFEDLEKNQDFKPTKKFDREKTRQRIFGAASAQPKENSDEARHDPKNAVASFDMAEGLEATLFSSEPNTLSLTNLDIDHRGRVWVCEVVNYRKRLGERPAGDRILILEDLDGDGRADKTKVYYQGQDIDSAMGICVLGNQVIVTASPNIIVFTDEDGDDKPDRKEILFSNTGQPQHDHSAHSVSFGPDGKLYWNFGNTGKQVCDREGKIVVDKSGNQVVDNGQPYVGGMTFRCNRDGGEFEVLGDNFRNNYEVTTDSYGTIWQSDNDDDGNRGVRINYVMEFGNFGYLDEITGAGWRESRTGMHEEIPLRHWHLRDPGVVPNLLQTGAGSPTGITIYEGRLLPKVFWDQIIHCDAGPHVVRSYPVTNDGAGYKARIVNIIDGARDDWFRPADVCVAPDGALFVTDWYDPGVGGHNMGDASRGRIFRIAPPGHKSKTPKFDFKTIRGAVAALRNPNYAVRAMAWTSLFEQGEAAAPALWEEFGSAENPRIKARALWLLGKIAAREGDLNAVVAKAIAHDDPNLRIVGLRLARQSEADVLDVVAKLVDDASPQVRRECAIALHHRKGPQAAQLWARLAAQHNGHDRWYLEALGIGADQHWDSHLAAWKKQVGGEWKSAAGRDIVWRSRGEKTPRYLQELILDQSASTADVLRYFRAFDFLGAGGKQDVLASLAFNTKGQSERDNLIAAEAVRRVNGSVLKRNPEYAAALEGILRRVRGTGSFVDLVKKFGLQDQDAELLKIAQAKATEQAGIEAVRLLLSRKRGRLLNKAIRSHDIAAAQQTAIAVSNAADGRSAKILLAIIRDDTVDLEVRRQATRGAAKIRYGALELLAMTKRGQLGESLKPAAAFQLHAAPWRDVQDEAIKLFPPPPARNSNPLPPISRLIDMQGDVGRGEQVFVKIGTCAKCHVVNGKGKEVGPNLSEIGSKLSRAAFFESILFPSAGISHNYETYSLILEDGNVVSGILVSKTGAAVTLKDAESLVRTIPTDEIEEMRKQTVSLMPADLQKTMTAEELVDVVQYLATLKKAAGK